MVTYLAGAAHEPLSMEAKELVRFLPEPRELKEAPIGLLATLLVACAVLLGTMVWLIRRRA